MSEVPGSVFRRLAGLSSFAEFNTRNAFNIGVDASESCAFEKLSVALSQSSFRMSAMCIGHVPGVVQRQRAS